MKKYLLVLAVVSFSVLVLPRQDVVADCLRARLVQALAAPLAGDPRFFMDRF